MTSQFVAAGERSEAPPRVRGSRGAPSRGFTRPGRRRRARRLGEPRRRHSSRRAGADRRVLRWRRLDRARPVCRAAAYLRRQRVPLRREDLRLWAALRSRARRAGPVPWPVHGAGQRALVPAVRAGDQRDAGSGRPAGRALADRAAAGGAGAAGDRADIAAALRPARGDAGRRARRLSPPSSSGSPPATSATPSRCSTLSGACGR